MSILYLGIFSILLKIKNKMIKVGNRIIGKGKKPLIIAEIGINHFGSLKLAKKIVDCAYQSGAEAVKAQIHIPDEEMSLEAKKIKPGNSNLSIYEVIKKNSLTLKDEKSLKDYIEKKKLIYIATPFSFAAAKWLNDNKTKIFKIGSGECNNLPLVEYIASFKKPIICSTGMNDLKAVSKTVKIFEKYNIKYALLHCVNLYPTPYKFIRMKRLLDIIRLFKKAVVGYSDHSIGTNMSIAAMSLGASIIEKHFVINKKKKGPDVICSMDKDELKILLKASNEIFDAFKKYNPILKSENVTRRFAFHSVVSKNKIKAGSKLSMKNLTTKRPATGDFHANSIYSLIGKKTLRDIGSNSQIKKKDIF